MEQVSNYMKRPNISVLLLDVTFGIVFALFNFDAIILALILPISCFGVLRGLTMRTTDEFRASFIHQDVLVVGGALALAIPAILLVMFAASVPREES